MENINFSQYHYYPCLQCSEPEQLGYRELSEDDKDAILPIVELSQIKNESSIAESKDAIVALIGSRPFILDLSKDRAPAAFVPKENADYSKIHKLQGAQDAYNEHLLSLLSPGDGFSAWRDCVGNFPNAIPVIQFTDPTTQSKSILRQAAQFWKSGFKKMAIRVNQECSDDIFPIVGQIIAFLDSADQLLFIADCGQGRRQIAERAEFAKRAVARVLEELDASQVLNISAVCLSDSYTSPPSGVLKVYESYSWELWREATSSFPFLFGDYAAHRRLKKVTTYMPGEWKAQVVYALPEAWIVYRHPDAQDVQGWIVGAQAIVKEPQFDDGLNCWGAALMKAAAKGNLEPFGSARYWHGAKINMHIHRQIKFAHQLSIGGEEFS